MTKSKWGSDMATEVNPQEHTSPGSESDHQRPKVSLVGETVPAHLSPHQHFSRKPSINSEHSIDQHGPVRRKSILHNAAHHNYGYHVTEDGKTVLLDTNVLVPACGIWPFVSLCVPLLLNTRPGTEFPIFSCIAFLRGLFFCFWLWPSAVRKGEATAKIIVILLLHIHEAPLILYLLLFCFE